MLIGALSTLDLRKHKVDIGGGKVMARRGTNHFELLPYASTRFTTARQVESLPNPLGDGHAAGACHSLNFGVFGVIQDYLQRLAIYMS
jgi:hypothetical protein